MNKIKNNWKTIVVGISSIALGFIAVFLGGSLYLTRNQSISPSAPQSVPNAAAPTTCQGLSVTFTTTATTTPTATSTSTPTPTGTATATPTTSPIAQATTTPTPVTTATPTTSPTTTPTATPAYVCNKACTTDSECKSLDQNYICYSYTNTCRHVNYPERQECAPAPTSNATATPHNAFECNSKCSTNSECLTIGSNYTCYNTGTDSRCRITTDLTSATCNHTSTSTSIASATRTPSATSLPNAGVGLPTTFLLGIAAILLIGSFLLI